MQLHLLLVFNILTSFLAFLVIEALGVLLCCRATSSKVQNDAHWEMIIVHFPHGVGFMNDLQQSSAGKQLGNISTPNPVIRPTSFCRGSLLRIFSKARHSIRSPELHLT